MILPVVCLMTRSRYGSPVRGDLGKANTLMRGSSSAIVLKNAPWIRGTITNNADLNISDGLILDALDRPLGKGGLPESRYDHRGRCLHGTSSDDVRVSEVHGRFRCVLPILLAAAIIHQFLDIVAEHRRPVFCADETIIPAVHRVQPAHSLGMPEEIIFQVLVEVQQRSILFIFAFRTGVVDAVGADLDQEMGPMQFLEVQTAFLS